MKLNNVKNISNINISISLFEIIIGVINDSKILHDTESEQYGYCMGYCNCMYCNDFIESYEFLQAKQLIQFYFNML